MISETSKTAVVVEKSFLKPDCLSFKYVFLQIQKLDHVLSFQKFSLVYIGNIEIGLKLLGSVFLSVFLSPLWIGETLLIFQDLGT